MLGRIHAFGVRNGVRKCPSSQNTALIVSPMVMTSTEFYTKHFIFISFLILMVRVNGQAIGKPIGKPQPERFKSYLHQGTTNKRQMQEPHPYYFPLAAVTCVYKLRRLKQHKCIILRSGGLMG